MSGPSVVATMSSRPPALMPPKVSKAWGRSVRALTDPDHAVQRKLAWAPPWASPSAKTRVPSLATELRSATFAYGLFGRSGIGRTTPVAPTWKSTG